MRKLVTIAGLALLAGCYHATVDTGLAPTGQTHNTWAHSFIYGLVPPSAVNGAQQCPGGVARVSTQIGFVHGLISALTFGIYTPMQITVTCAAAGANPDIRNADPNAALAEAIELARQDRRDVVVEFTSR